MIRYIRDSYWSQVFVLRGGIVVSLVTSLLLYFLYCALWYTFLRKMDIHNFISDDRSSMHIISGCVSFLLIFRLHQCHERYSHAGHLCSMYFTDIHHLAGSVCAYANSASGADPQLVLATQVHVSRLMIAMAVALKFHCRIAENALLGGKLSADKAPLMLFDYFRIKGLLCSREQDLLDAACGLLVTADDKHDHRASFHVKLTYQSRQDQDSSTPGGNMKGKSFNHRSDDEDEYVEESGVSLVTIIMQFVRNHLAEAVRQKIVVERMMNLIEADLRGISFAFSQLDQLIVMPLPLAYLQHCKIIFLSFVVVYPLTIDTMEGFWANVISPCLIFMALLGFEVLADAMENPLGDDALDVNVMEMIHELELRIQKAFNVSVAHRDLLLEDSKEIIATLRPQRQGSRLSGSESSEGQPKHPTRVFTEPGKQSQAEATPMTHSHSDATPKFNRQTSQEPSVEGQPAKAAQPGKLRPPMQNSQRFEFHFCWLMMPPHIKEHMNSMAFGDWKDIPFSGTIIEKLRSDWSQDALQNCGPCAEATGYNGLKLADMFADQHSMVNHFLCLRIRQHTIQHICDRMAEEISPDDYYQEYIDQKNWKTEVSLDRQESGTSDEDVSLSVDMTAPASLCALDRGAESDHDTISQRQRTDSGVEGRRRTLFRQKTLLTDKAKSLLGEFNERFENEHRFKERRRHIDSIRKSHRAESWSPKGHELLSEEPFSD